MKTKERYYAPLLNRKIIFVTLLSLVSLFTLLPIGVNAQTDGLNLGTAPSSEKLQLQPGETYDGEIVVWNLLGRTIPYNIFITGFRQIENQPGTAIMLTEEEEERALYSASSWVTVDKERINLVPNKNEKIFYQINVPKNATKGEYMVIISFISDTGEEIETTGTTSVLSSGTPILIKIGEDFVENAELISFVTDKNFYEYPNVIFQTRLNNLGDTHISPVGEIILTNIFKQEVATIPFNENGQSILRDSNAEYQTPWDYGSFLSSDKKLILGPIKAELIVLYRNVQPGFAPLMANTSFWVLPWKYIVLLLLIIVTIVAILKSRKKRKEAKDKSKQKQLPK